MKKALAWLVLAGGLGVSGPIAAQTTWDMATPYPDGNFHTKNVRQFVDDVAGATAGKLKITVHSNASLIKMPEIKRAVQTGQVPAGEVLLSVLANEDAMFGFDSNPFLVTNYPAAAKLWVVAKPYIEQRLEKQGLKLLFSVPWPPQGIYAKKPIESIVDLKGSKFRSYSPVTARLAELMGATPTTVQVPELAQAFRTGLVDAMITSAATGVDTQSWDYLSHYYDTQAFLPQNIVFVSKRAFDALDAATQKSVLDSAANAEKRGWATSESENTRFRLMLEQKGLKVGPPSAKLAAELNDIGQAMSAEWAKKAGPDGEALLAAVKK